MEWRLHKWTLKRGNWWPFWMDMFKLELEITIITDWEKIGKWGGQIEDTNKSYLINRRHLDLGLGLWLQTDPITWFTLLVWLVVILKSEIMGCWKIIMNAHSNATHVNYENIWLWSDQLHSKNQLSLIKSHLYAIGQPSSTINGMSRQSWPNSNRYSIPRQGNTMIPSELG